MLLQDVSESMTVTVLDSVCGYIIFLEIAELVIRLWYVIEHGLDTNLLVASRQPSASYCC